MVWGEKKRLTGKQIYSGAKKESQRQNKIFSTYKESLWVPPQGDGS